MPNGPSVLLPSARLRAVRERISLACKKSGRSPDEVTLIAVSKTKPAEAIAELVKAGQFEFGENYLQEALDKIRMLSDPRIDWHFIGHIQSNKCAEIANAFQWVHSIDRLKIARRLNQAALDLGKTLKVMVQVNVQSEESKSGVSVADLPEMLREVSELNGLRLKGLMAIPKPESDPDLQRQPFAELRRMMLRARDDGINMDCLSMGMSADLEPAIIEGATHVRVGTALFGPRNYSNAK